MQNKNYVYLKFYKHWNRLCVAHNVVYCMRHIGFCTVIERNLLFSSKIYLSLYRQLISYSQRILRWQDGCGIWNLPLAEFFRSILFRNLNLRCCFVFPENNVISILSLLLDLSKPTTGTKSLETSVFSLPSTKDNG